MHIGMVIHGYGGVWIEMPKNWSYVCEQLTIPDVGTFIQMKDFIYYTLECPREFIQEINNSCTGTLNIVFSTEALGTKKLMDVIHLISARYDCSIDISCASEYPTIVISIYR